MANNIRNHFERNRVTVGTRSVPGPQVNSPTFTEFCSYLKNSQRSYIIYSILINNPLIQYINLIEKESKIHDNNQNNNNVDVDINDVHEINYNDQSNHINNNQANQSSIHTPEPSINYPPQTPIRDNVCGVFQDYLTSQQQYQQKYQHYQLQQG